MTEKELWKQALEAFKNKDNSTAKTLFNRFVLNFPDSDLADNAHYNLGIIYEIEGHYNKALVHFSIVLDRYPDSDAAIFVPDKIEALKEKSDPASELFYEAQRFQYTGNIEQAWQTYRRITEQYSNSDLVDNAWLGLGMINLKKGNSIEARRCFEKILSDYSDSDAAELVPELLSGL